jgi:glycolate oxidase iron-sulfur subunit
VTTVVEARGSAHRPLAVADDDLVTCVACGLCLPHCPTYRVTGLEFASPRGRIAAMRAVQLDGAPVDAEFERAMEECVQCRGCEAACPSSVPFGRLMESARVTLQCDRRGDRTWRRRLAEWAGYRLVLPRHRLLLALSWLLLIAQRLHLVPRRYSLPKLSATSLARRLGAAPIADGDCVLFTGCVMDAWQRDVHHAALAVMRATGARPAVSGPAAACCGALHAHAGRLDEARALARQVIAALPGDAPVVVDSAGCGAAMKDYGHLLGTSDAEVFARRVRDFSEWLGGRAPLAVRDTGARVVVADPCHLRHVQHAAEPVRRVLRDAYALIELDDDGLCCGAGGAYAVGQPRLAGAIRDRKVAAIAAAAGDESVIVASANPGCAMHLAAAGLDVRHPAELLAAALVGDHGDG